MVKKMKLLILALDGVDPKIAQNAPMPNLKSLGKIREIKSYPNSGPAWGSFLTGVNPREHGIMPMGLRTKISSLKATPIWEKVNCKIGIANLPIAEKPIKVNGWFIAGMLCPSVASCAYPPILSKKLLRWGYEIALEGGDWTVQDPAIGNEFLQKEWKRILPKRTKTFRLLLKNYPVDFAILFYTCLDSIQHRLMHEKDTVIEWYARLDEEIGKILDLGSFDNVIALSDHGFQHSGVISEYDQLLMNVTLRRWRRVGENLNGIIQTMIGRRRKKFITGSHTSKALFVSNLDYFPKKIEEILDLRIVSQLG